MNTKSTLDIILKLITEETKRIKKKKKNSKVSIPVLKRPMGSISFMDSAISLNESDGRYAGKPITKKFNHLKWPLDDFQKQFLDDFISISEKNLREADYKYASNRTGIPIESIKSIRNTLGETKKIQPSENDLRAKYEDVVGGMLYDVNKQFTDVRDLPKDKNGRFYPMNNEPEFRGVTPGEMMYNKRLKDDLQVGIERGIDCKNGVLDRGGNVKLPDFMFEWLMYFIEGSEIVNITKSEILDERFSNKSINHKYVMFSIDAKINESKISGLDLMSNKHLKELKMFEEKIKEFNESFGTNFEIEHQFTDSKGLLKVFLENKQILRNGNIQNLKRIDMTQTDEYRQMIYNLMKSFDAE